MALLEPENNNNNNSSMEKLVSELPMEKQFALFSLTRQLDKIITIGEKPKDAPYSGYVRFKETEIEEYRNLVKGIVTQLFMKNVMLEDMVRKSL